MEKTDQLDDNLQFISLPTHGLEHTIPFQDHTVCFGDCSFSSHPQGKRKWRRIDWGRVAVAVSASVISIMLASGMGKTLLDDSLFFPLYNARRSNAKQSTTRETNRATIQNMVQFTSVNDDAST